MQRKKRKLKFSTLGVCLFLLYLYTYSIQEMVYRSDKIAVFSLIVSLMFFIPSFRKIRITKWDILWGLALIFIIFRNYDMANGNYYLVAETVLCIMFIFVLSRSGQWNFSYIRLSLFFGFAHVILGFAFYLLPDFYLNNVVPLMGLDSYWSLRLQLMVDSGFMVGLTTHHSTLGIYFSILLMLLFAIRFVEENKQKRKVFDILILIVVSNQW